MIGWVLLGRGHQEDLGLLPAFFDEGDPRTAKEQAAANYAHGGGWCPQDGWELSEDQMTAVYPGDPPQRALAVATLRDETLLLFPHAYVAIVQPDGAFEMARMD
jgi:hypothetical protein